MYLYFLKHLLNKVKLDFVEVRLPHPVED